MAGGRRPDPHRRRHNADGYRFEAIPDGISLSTRGKGRVDLFVNHETSTVAVPVHRRGADRQANSQNDFDERPGEPARAQPAQQRACSGSLRDRLERELPAFLLELPRDGEGGLRPRHLLHERGSVRTGCTAGTAWTSRSPRHAQAPSRSASSSPTTRRPASTRRSTGWAGTTTRTTWRSPATRRPGRALRRRHVLHNAGDSVPPAGITAPRGRSSTATSRPTRTPSGRQGRSLGVRLRQPGLRRLLRLRRRRHDRRSQRHFIKVPKDDRDGQESRTAPSYARPTLGYVRCRRRQGSRDSPGSPTPQWVLDQWAQRASNNWIVRSRTCSASCASRTSPTTSGPACPTSSTSRTPVGRRPARPAPAQARPTAASGSWYSNEDDPTKVDSLSILVEGDNDHLAARERLSRAHTARSINPTTSRRRRTGA